jgi:hypothetical protein
MATGDQQTDQLSIPDPAAVGADADAAETAADDAEATRTGGEHSQQGTISSGDSVQGLASSAATDASDAAASAGEAATAWHERMARALAPISDFQRLRQPEIVDTPLGKEVVVPSGTRVTLELDPSPYTYGDVVSVLFALVSGSVAARFYVEYDNGNNDFSSIEQEGNVFRAEGKALDHSNSSSIIAFRVQITEQTGSQEARVTLPYVNEVASIAYQRPEIDEDAPGRPQVVAALLGEIERAGTMWDAPKRYTSITSTGYGVDRSGARPNITLAAGGSVEITYDVGGSQPDDAVPFEIGSRVAFAARVLEGDATAKVDVQGWGGTGPLEEARRGRDPAGDVLYVDGLLVEDPYPADETKNVNRVVITITNASDNDAARLSLPVLREGWLFDTPETLLPAPDTLSAGRSETWSVPSDGNAALDRLAARALDAYVDDQASGSGTLTAPAPSLADVDAGGPHIETTPAPDAPASVGLLRETVLREALALPVSGHARDVQHGKGPQALPVLSAFNAVDAGAWSLKSGYSNVYEYTGDWHAERHDDISGSTAAHKSPVLEVDASTPTGEIGLLQGTILTEQASLADVEATPGSYRVTSWDAEANTATWVVHPSDSQAPGSGAYRHEVAVRQAAHSHFDAHDAIIEGIHQVYSARDDGLQMGERALLDRAVIERGTLHHAVIRSGLVRRTLFVGAGVAESSLEAGDVEGGTVLTFYSQDATGEEALVEECAFLGGGNHIYAHSSASDGSLNHARLTLRGTVHTGDAQGSAGGWSGPEGGGTLGGGADERVFEDIYIYKRHEWTGGNAPWSRYRRVIANEVTRSAISNKGTMDVALDDCIIRVTGRQDEYAPGKEPAVLLEGQSDMQHARRCIFWVDRPGATTTGDVRVSEGQGCVYIYDGAGGFPGFAAVDLEGSFGSCDQTRRNNVYIQLSGSAPAWKGRNNPDGNTTVFDTLNAFQREASTDEGSIYIDLRNDPRGLRAVYRDPEAGDFRLADTQVARVGAGPSDPLTGWPHVPPASEIKRQIERLPA